MGEMIGMRHASPNERLVGTQSVSTHLNGL